MFRVGLVIAFIAATLASPVVCCCVAAPGTTSAARDDRSLLPSPSGCCAQRRSNRTDSSAPSQRDQGPCRCREHARQAVTVESLDSLLQLLLRPMAALVHDLSVAQPFTDQCLVAIEAPHVGRAVAFPHLTVREILRALQTMRC